MVLGLTTSILTPPVTEEMFPDDRTTLQITINSGLRFLQGLFRLGKYKLKDPGLHVQVCQVWKGLTIWIQVNSTSTVLGHIHDPGRKQIGARYTLIRIENLKAPQSTSGI